MTRLENVSVTINGVTVYPSSVDITQGIGKGFNDCILSGINLSGSVDEIVVVTINGDPFTFLVDEKAYGKSDSITMTCKGQPVILNDDSLSDEIYTYTSSDELIEDSRGVIPVVNNIPNIVFANQSYSKTSTPMSRILDMVRVVGGEAYEVDGTLYLDTLSGIPAVPTIDHVVLDSEVFSFSYFDKRTTTNKVKQVLINPINQDIYAEPSVTLDIEESNGVVYFNPSLSAGFEYTVSGLEVQIPLQMVKEEIIRVDGDTFIKTVGGIDTLIYLSLNGIPIDVAEYVLYPTYNVVRFLTPQTGEVSIKYNTKGVKVFASRDTAFSIIYQCTIVQDVIEIDADNVVSNGLCRGEVFDPLTYENQGKVTTSIGQDIKLLYVEERGATELVYVGQYTLSGGGILIVEYLHSGTPWVDTAFMTQTASSIVEEIQTSTDEVIYDTDLSRYLIYLDRGILSINDIYFGSTQLSGYSYNDGVADNTQPHIVFQASDVGKDVDMSLTYEVVVLALAPPEIGHPVTILDLIVCSGVASTQYVLDEDALCSLPVTFYIDVANSLGLEINDVFGATLTGDFGSLSVDNFGRVSVRVSSQGIYIIDCSSVKIGATITVNSEGVI